MNLVNHENYVNPVQGLWWNSFLVDVFEILEL